MWYPLFYRGGSSKRWRLGSVRERRQSKKSVNYMDTFWTRCCSQRRSASLGDRSQVVFSFEANGVRNGERLTVIPLFRLDRPSSGGRLDPETVRCVSQFLLTSAQSATWLESKKGNGFLTLQSIKFLDWLAIVKTDLVSTGSCGL